MKGLINVAVAVFAVWAACMIYSDLQSMRASHSIQYRAWLDKCLDEGGWQVAEFEGDIPVDSQDSRELSVTYQSCLKRSNCDEFGEYVQDGIWHKCE